MFVAVIVLHCDVENKGKEVYWNVIANSVYLMRAYLSFLLVLGCLVLMSRLRQHISIVVAAYANHRTMTLPLF